MDGCPKYLTAVAEFLLPLRRDSALKAVHILVRRLLRRNLEFFRRVEQVSTLSRLPWKFLARESIIEAFQGMHTFPHADPLYIEIILLWRACLHADPFYLKVFGHVDSLAAWGRQVDV